MSDANLTVIALFDAPALVIRQYAGHCGEHVEILLTIGKCWRNAFKCPCTDEIRRNGEKPLIHAGFSHSSVHGGPYEIGLSRRAKPVKSAQSRSGKAVEKVFERSGIALAGRTFGAMKRGTLMRVIAVS